MNRMFEIADRLLAAAAVGRPAIAVATAIAIEGSAPRTVGTSMALVRDADGSERVIGTIAGGCVEGAIVDTCQEVLATGESQTVDYGISDDDAFSIGLTCGGDIRIHVQLFTDDLERSLEAGDAVEVCAEFTEQAPPVRRMIILGSMEFSAALARAASAAGYRVTVADSRPLFLTAERFPSAERVVEWPTEFLARTAIDSETTICVLSHDWRFDAECLAIALRSPAGYVGAMGSRTTHARRVASLRERGLTDAELARLRSPIGLSIGASTPEETAISILAEVIAARSGAVVASLAAVDGPIHARVP
jgi:xanthine dehydrogenase accessory factor